MHPFPSRRYVLPSCTLTRLSRADSRGLAERLVAMDPWRTLHYRADTLAAYLGRPDAGFARFTVTVSGQAAGFVALRYPWLKGVYLELLALFPPHQGQGLGQELLLWVEAPVPPPHQKSVDRGLVLQPAGPPLLCQARLWRGRPPGEPHHPRPGRAPAA